MQMQESSTSPFAGLLRPLMGVTLGLAFITVVAYPLAVTAIGQVAFKDQANGSIISVNGHDVGSSLVGQVFSTPAYFHGRPSAAGAGFASGWKSVAELAVTLEQWHQATSLSRAIWSLPSA